MPSRFKGLNTVIEAAAELQREEWHIDFHVIGEGDDRSTMEEMATRMMPSSDGFKFSWARRWNDASGRIIGRTRLGHAKRQTGLWYCVLRSYATLSPCIGVAHGGPPEVLSDGHTGLLVKFGNQEQLNA